MGRRYGDDDEPAGEGRLVRFLGGLILGVLVCGGVIAALSVNLPYPEPVAEVEPPAQETALAPRAEPAIPVREAAPRAPTSLAPAPLPSIGGPQRPSQPESLGTARGPASPGGMDSPVAGDFGSTGSGLGGIASAPEMPSLGGAPMPSSPVARGPALQLEGPALTINAVPFDAPAGMPLIAVILNDAGGSDLTTETLLSLSLPLTLGIVARDAENVALAAEAKLAGYEVVAQMPVSTESEPASEGAVSDAMTDVEVADRAEAMLTELWMSVGASARPADGAAVDPRITRSLIAVLERNGFAFVSPDVAANEAGSGLAQAFDVPHAAQTGVVPDDADVAEAYAAIEAAAARAQSDGTAIISGPASRAMLEALLRWGLEKGGQDALFAPMSAVIQRQAGG